jgi:hypothetical protein
MQNKPSIYNALPSPEHVPVAGGHNKDSLVSFGADEIEGRKEQPVAALIKNTLDKRPVTGKFRRRTSVFTSKLKTKSSNSLESSRGAPV